MKTFIGKFLLMSILLSTGVIISCENKVDDLTIGEPFDQVEGMGGTWNLLEVKIIDELTIEKESMDLSAIFLSEPTTLSFDSETLTYTIETPSDVPNFLGEGGSWAFDNNDFPKKLMLSTSTSNIELGAPIRTFDDKLIIKVTKTCIVNEKVKPVLSYQYEFERVEN